MRRDAFLGRVSAATMNSTLPEAPRVLPALPELPAADLVTLFRNRAQAINTVVHGPMSRHGVPRAVVGIAAGHGAAGFLAWDDLPVPGVSAALQSAGGERLAHEVPAESRIEHNLSYLDVAVGVTGADAALAESGSVVLIHGRGRPRMASLAPEVHVVLLAADRIRRTLAHWAHEEPDRALITSNLVIVTGPSRTGDIEQRLNLGVHGPRHVHVVIIR
ncbi:MAG TPA: lactate utilization protein [Acidimicrobiia bacterium]|nr:lactate utilization protein [Acidimicrobiia bacterium]